MWSTAPRAAECRYGRLRAPKAATARSARDLPLRGKPNRLLLRRSLTPRRGTVYVCGRFERKTAPPAAGIAAGSPTPSRTLPLFLGRCDQGSRTWALWAPKGHHRPRTEGWVRPISTTGKPPEDPRGREARQEKSRLAVEELRRPPLGREYNVADEPGPTAARLVPFSRHSGPELAVISRIAGRSRVTDSKRGILVHRLAGN